MNYLENNPLLGTSRAKNFVGNSKTAYAKFMAKLKTAAKNEKIFVTIG